MEEIQPRNKNVVLYTGFFPRSPFFRGFRGWRQIRENNTTAILGVVAYTIYSVSQHRVDTYYIEV